MKFKSPPIRAIKRKPGVALVLNLFMGSAGVVLWWLLYKQLPGLSKWLTYDLLPIQQGSHLGDSIEFFLYDTPKVMMLLFLEGVQNSVSVE